MLKSSSNFSIIFLFIIIISIIVGVLIGFFFLFFEKPFTLENGIFIKKDGKENFEQDTQKPILDKEKSEEEVKGENSETKIQIDSTSVLNEKIHVISFLKERGIYDDSYIYKEYENEKYYLFDTFVLSYVLTFMISKEEKKLSCIQSSISKEPFCGNMDEYKTPTREPIPLAKIYNTPKEVYEDFRKAIITEDFVLFRQTIAGEAEENYGFSPTQSSYSPRYNRFFQMKEIAEEKFNFDYFKENENFWVHGPNGERVKFEGGHIFLKNGLKILAMKLGDTWKIIED